MVAVSFSRRDILDGLRSRGFQLNDGPHGAGMLLLASTRAGGYYLGAFRFRTSATLRTIPLSTLGCCVLSSLPLPLDTSLNPPMFCL